MKIEKLLRKYVKEEFEIDVKGRFPICPCCKSNLEPLETNVELLDEKYLDCEVYGECPNCEKNFIWHEYTFTFGYSKPTLFDD